MGLLCKGLGAGVIILIVYSSTLFLRLEGLKKELEASRGALALQSAHFKTLEVRASEFNKQSQKLKASFVEELAEFTLQTPPLKAPPFLKPLSPKNFKQDSPQLNSCVKELETLKKSLDYFFIKAP